VVLRPKKLDIRKKEINHTWGEIEKIAKNREDWKSLVLALCASGCNKD
jgi:hypothetical protein